MCINQRLSLESLSRSNIPSVDEMYSSGLKVVCYKKLVIQVELQQLSRNHHKSDNLQPMWQWLSSKLPVLNKFYIQRAQEKKKLFHRRDRGFGLAALGRYFTPPRVETSSVFCRSARICICQFLLLHVLVCVRIWFRGGGGGRAGCFFLDVFGV
jgi:hypothetical protein